MIISTDEGKVGITLWPAVNELPEDLVAGFCIRSIVLVADLNNHFMDELLPAAGLFQFSQVAPILPVLPRLPGIVSAGRFPEYPFISIFHCLVDPAFVDAKRINMILSIDGFGNTVVVVSVVLFGLPFVELRRNCVSHSCTSLDIDILHMSKFLRHSKKRGQNVTTYVEYM